MERFRLNGRARKVIDKVMKENNYTQIEICNSLNKQGYTQPKTGKPFTQADFSAIMTGRQRKLTDVFKLLYKEFDKDKRLEFLNHIGDYDNPGWEKYVKEHEYDSVQRSLLNPFYQRIGDLYEEADNKLRCKILVNLENVLCELEEKND